MVHLLQARSSGEMAPTLFLGAQLEQSAVYTTRSTHAQCLTLG